MSEWKIMISVLKARNLPNNVNELYLTIELSNIKKKSKKIQIHENKEVEWNETFNFLLKDNENLNSSCHLKIIIYNWEIHQNFGIIEINLFAFIEEIVNNKNNYFSKDDWYPFRNIKNFQKSSFTENKLISQGEYHGDLKIKIEIEKIYFDIYNLSQKFHQSTAEGAHIVYESKNNKIADLVFIHGFVLNYIETWTNVDQSIFWLNDWLIRDLPDIRIINIYYNINIQNNEKSYFEDRSSYILKELISPSIKIGKRPIIFLAYSLGGLILQQMILDMHNNNSEIFQKILKRIVGIIFFGTPYGKSRLSELSNKYLIPESAEYLNKDLCNEKKLFELNFFFKNYIKEENQNTLQKIQVLNYEETQPIPNENFIVVQNPPIDYGITISLLFKHHLNITKPVNDSDIVYKNTIGFLYNVIKFYSDLLQNKLKNEKQAILFNASQTGYCGTLSRQEAELKLQNKPDGTFLTRWSETSKNFVLSYIQNNLIFHIGHIKQNKNGTITVITNKGKEKFSTLNDYIEVMKLYGIITKPIHTQNYQFSPT